MEQYCPKDYNRGDDMEAHCNVGGLPCPPAKDVDPATVVSVSCGPCSRSWGIPIGDVMKGKTKGKHQCVLGECAAKIETPAKVDLPPLNQGESAPPAAKKAQAKK